MIPRQRRGLIKSGAKKALERKNAGWTQFVRSRDTRIVYCSSSTGNNGTAVVGDPTKPYADIDTGFNALRDGFPDWLLLKRGDVWVNSSFGELNRSGRSPTQPILVSSYGTGARPKIQLLGNDDFGRCVYTNPSDPDRDFIAFVGIEFYANARDPASPDYNPATLDLLCEGFDLHAGLTWWLIEDCKLSFFQDNIAVDSSGTNSTFRMRRNIIVNAHADEDTVGHSEGMYIAHITHPYFEENLWDTNGWSPDVPEPLNSFNRNLYIHEDCGTATVKGDMYLRSAAEGMQLRTGGTMTGCLSVENVWGFDVGHQASEPAPNIDTAYIASNVVMDFDGDGIHTLNASTTGVQMHDNIMTRDGNLGYAGISFDSDCTGCVARDNIIFNCDNGFRDLGSNTITGNDIDTAGTNNNPGGASPSEPFLAPTRTLAGYHGSIGGTATTAAFVEAAKLQSRDNWNPRLTARAVNNYIRNGFNRMAL